MNALAETALASRSLDPFGIELKAEGRYESIHSLDIDHLKQLVADHGVVVLRGFSTFPDKDDFTAFARRFGDLLEWNFGFVLDLVVHDDPRNYLFTNGPVPHHWDGAFAARVPSLQIFRCLQSPGAGAGGETTFCDTARVIRNAGAAQRSAWEKISIRYQTEKIAHYGGVIEQKLVDVHPVKGVPILRFAEPVTGLNPLFLEVNGLEGESQEEFLNGFTPRLYSADVLYAHEWRTGDFVLADNHLLIHGRNAFKTNAPRRIQRIHVL
jgi:alpha-ketoglutarate-dependent taurine dioxygenase